MAVNRKKSNTIAIRYIILSGIKKKRLIKRLYVEGYKSNKTENTTILVYNNVKFSWQSVIYKMRKKKSILLQFLENVILKKDMRNCIEIYKAHS